MNSITDDREKYLGGSDIPTIMGINPFCSRYDLLLEKAGLKERKEISTPYTEYGHTIEPKIRDYINKQGKYNYQVDVLYDDNVRCNFDGIDYEKSSVLEIKSTSQIKKSLKGYKRYVVQLLFYMMKSKSPYGLLAVYERPKDFNTDFDSSRLTTYPITLDSTESLQKEIMDAINIFYKDLEKIKQDPFLTEEDL